MDNQTLKQLTERATSPFIYGEETSKRAADVLIQSANSLTSEQRKGLEENLVHTMSNYGNNPKLKLDAEMAAAILKALAAVTPIIIGIFTNRDKKS